MNTVFWKAGHTPTLCRFSTFDLSFMVWYLLRPLAVADRHRSEPHCTGEKKAYGRVRPSWPVQCCGY